MKTIGPLISCYSSLSGNRFRRFLQSKQTSSKDKDSDTLFLVQKEKEKETRILRASDVEGNPKKLDEWLKKLNDRIESEDVTRFGVRFLEIIRNILEWVKEKVDAKIESYEKEKPIKNEKKGIFRETRQEGLRFSNMG
jgi:hypothetical protein